MSEKFVKISVKELNQIVSVLGDIPYKTIAGVMRSIDQRASEWMQAAEDDADRIEKLSAMISDCHGKIAELQVDNVKLTAELTATIEVLSKTSDELARLRMPAVPFEFTPSFESLEGEGFEDNTDAQR